MTAAAAFFSNAAFSAGVNTDPGGCVDWYHENAAGTARQIASRIKFRH